MRTPLSVAARVELGAYRAAASAYRCLLALRLAFPGEPDRRRVLAERLGRWDGAAANARPTLWVHAASLGEVLAAGPLLTGLRAEHPSYRVVLTCHTTTGHGAGAKTIADEVRYFPVDTPVAVERVLTHMRPSAFVFVETEIWPSLLLLLARRGVVAAMVNGSVSDRSFARYRRVQSLFAAALGTLAAVCARDRDSERRLVALGAPAERTRVCGDLKSDALDAQALAEVPDALASITAPVLVAASTHFGEDEVVLDAFATVHARHVDARLVLAPRHPERATAVLAAARSRRWKACLRSEGLLDGDWSVLVLDTTGELRSFLKSATAVFVGGSLVDVGGHNLFEPALFARPIASGPRLAGVRDQADALSRHSALVNVDNAESLARCWSAWLENTQVAHAAGQRARAAVAECGGALRCTLEALSPLLARTGALGAADVEGLRG